MESYAIFIPLEIAANDPIYDGGYMIGATPVLGYDSPLLKRNAPK